jgi:hypothetical protein
MKLTMKLFLIISLFCTVALADEGDMGQGSKSDNSGGGFACVECVVNDSETRPEDGSFLKIIQNYFSDLLG